MDKSINPLHPETPSQRNVFIVTAFLGVLFIAGTIIFGTRVLLVGAIALAVSAAIEALFAYFRKQPLDKSWMVTPLVLTLLLPPTLPVWMAGVGSAFGVFFGKAIFGGTGRTVFNPAAVGWIFLFINFPRYMATDWLNPQTGQSGPDIPLTELAAGTFDYAWNDILLGNIPGAIGETFALGIIVLGLALIVFKVIDWRIPLVTIGSAFALLGIGHLLMPDTFAQPLEAVLVGGLLFASFFVATDPVTAPVKKVNRVYYAIGIALITVVIRTFSAAPEGVVFAIVLMNAIGSLFEGNEANVETEGVEAA